MNHVLEGSMLLLSLSHIWLCDPTTAAHKASLSFTISQSLLKLLSIEFVMPSNHLVLYCLLLHLPSIFLASGSFLMALHIRNFSFSLSPSSEYSGLISFRMDRLDLLAVQETLRSLLQHHSSKASIIWCSAFFYCPALTSIHDYWKNHSFDYMDLCQQSDVSVLKC